MRSPRLRLPVLAILCGLAAAVLTMQPAAAGTSQLRGANMHPFWADSGASTYDQEFAMLQAAHANSVRVDLSWQSLEWKRGIFDPRVVAETNAILADAGNHGLKVILTLWQTPCWASSAPPTVSLGCSYGWWKRNVGKYPPVDPQYYADAARFVALNWGSQLAALEVWNEPNSQSFFISKDRPGDYTKLLVGAYGAVKTVAPSLPVLATMAGSDQKFMAGLYKDGARGSYDGIGVHPYNDPRFAQLQAFRAYETSQQDQSPLWVTEFGWPSNSVGDGRQASLIADGFRQLAKFSWVAAAEVYEVRDQGYSGSNEDNFGMLMHDMTPKPSWLTFSQTLAQLP